MRKLLLWFSGMLLGVTVLAMALVWLLIQPPAPGVTPENFKRLYKGMGEKEAEAVLGRKADESAHVTGHHFSYWAQGDYRVYLDVSDTLLAGDMTLPDGKKMDLGKPPESPLDRLRKLLGY